MTERSCTTCKFSDRGNCFHTVGYFAPCKFRRETEEDACGPSGALYEVRWTRVNAEYDKQKWPLIDRTMHIHSARVYLREARARRGTAFAFTLLQWAANCRRRAAKSKPDQGDLFERRA